MDHHDQPQEEYNPSRDYGRVMNWFKWGGGIFIISALALRYLIG
jgi:hypothetical protein